MRLTPHLNIYQNPSKSVNMSYITREFSRTEVDIVLAYAVSFLLGGVHYEMLHNVRKGDRITKCYKGVGGS